MQSFLEERKTMTPKEGLSVSVVMAILWGWILIPRYPAAGLQLGLDDLICVLFVPVFVAYLLTTKDSWLVRGSRLTLLLWWVTLIGTGVIFGLLHSYLYFDEMILPTEMWQYVKRMVFFYVALYVSLNRLMTARRFYVILTVVAGMTLFIGLLQANQSGIGVYLAKLYQRGYLQIRNIMYADFAGVRVYGVAGHSNAWGGLAMFFFSALLPTVFAGSIENPRKGSLKTIFLRLGFSLVMLMALLNVVLSMSRSAIVAAALAYFVLIVLGAYASKRHYSFVLKNLALTGTIIVVLWSTMSQKLAYVYDRFNVLMQTDLMGGKTGRAEQIEWALGLLKNGYDYAFGVGNALARDQTSSWGTEVEMVHLLALYGIFGCILRYGLVLWLFWTAIKQVRAARYEERALAMGVVACLTGYMAHSLGYFFFSDIAVGVPPWLLFGWVVGAYYRRQRDLNAS